MSSRGRAKRQTGRRALLSRQWKRTAFLIGAMIAVLTIAASAFLIISSPGEQSEPSAAIVDQLSLTFPNPSFVQEATTMLQEAGYVVDYYQGEEVTVQLYRELPTRSYDLIILLVHSARLMRPDQITLGDDVHLFTSEPYTLMGYDEEQTARRLSIASYGEDSPRDYFGIAPGFVESSMRGKFKGATVIMMGCDGLRSDAMAEAFVRKGAAVVVG